jgi:spermidine synthase
MIEKPKYISLVTGHAEGEDALIAFETALKEAGLGQLNLVSVTPVVPAGTRFEPLYEPPAPQIAPTILAQAESATPGETIATAVALGLSPEGWGLVRTASGSDRRALELEEEARAQVQAAFEAYGQPLHELHAASIEHTVKRQGCVIAAAVLWEEEAAVAEADWVTEAWTPYTHCKFRIREHLYKARTSFQRIDIVETVEFGRMLLLDNAVQTTERDEWAYHEMLAYVPLFAHPAPRRVLIVGGGDGGLLRTVLDHPDVERVVQVEIDRQVVEASKKYLPSVSRGAFDDPRATVVYEDAFEYLERVDEPFDVALLDTTDPIGPAERLFTSEFYSRVAEALGEQGIAVAQSGSPWFQPELIARATGAMRTCFPLTRLYLGFVPTYPAGLWAFALGTRGHDPASISLEELTKRFAPLRGKTRYFTPEIYRAAFTLPPFIEDLLR